MGCGWLLLGNKVTAEGAEGVLVSVVFLETRGESSYESPTYLDEHIANRFFPQPKPPVWRLRLILGLKWPSATASWDKQQYQQSSPLPVWVRM